MNTLLPERSKLSLDHFHMGQNLAGSDTEKALRYFTLSLKDVDNGGVDQKIVGENWENYIRATIAYMQINLIKLEEILPSISNEERKVIITRFITGLKMRGKPDYDEDYSSPRPKM